MRFNMSMMPFYRDGETKEINMKNIEPLIKEFMTLQPQTIECHETLETAKKKMIQSSIRHLPVSKKGKIIGILSERELNLAYGIESLDPKHLLVIDACSEKPYIVDPETPLREVVDTMAKKHLGSALVMEGSKLIGIFTTVDACRSLHDLLEETLEKKNREVVRTFRFFIRKA